MTAVVASYAIQLFYRTWMHGKSYQFFFSQRRYDYYGV